MAIEQVPQLTVTEPSQMLQVEDLSVKNVILVEIGFFQSMRKKITSFASNIFFSFLF